jgi:hypothetical protein
MGTATTAKYEIARHSIAGARRMREIAAEDAAAAAIERDRIVADLSGPKTYTKTVLAEQVAFALVRSRRLRTLGRAKEADALGRHVARLLAQLFGAGPAK